MFQAKAKKVKTPHTMPTPKKVNTNARWFIFLSFRDIVFENVQLKNNQNIPALSLTYRPKCWGDDSKHKKYNVY